ncbi:MAG: hypothetical protein HDS37_03470 [Bacteroides sp.]|nr:hypothetical protein [Bacteroides sp.]
MTDNLILNDYLLSLPMKVRKAFVIELIAQLRISPSQLQSWRHRNISIPYLYRREINRIAGKEVFADVDN